MKNVHLMTGLLLVILTACNDSNSNTTSLDAKVAQTKATAQSVDWIITYYVHKDTDQTSSFAGYTFTFKPDATLTALKTPTTVAGQWSVSHDDSGNDINDDNSASSSNDIDFNISFASPSAFAELTEDWKILSINDSTIELTHISGGNGGTDFVTFKKP